jgi:hypothetical protein
MRTFSTLVLAYLLVSGTMPGPALAQNAHFIGTANVQGIFADGTATVSFKEAGLGSNVSIDYEFSAFAVANYGCVNKGGNHPQATNKETVQGPVSATGTFSSGKNGTISQTLTLSPPLPPTDFGCPGGQVLVLADITYSSLALTDTTNNVSASLDTASLTRVFVTFK